MGTLDGKAAIVTGAGSGIGRAVARRFGMEGAKIAVTDVDATRAKAVADELGDQAFDLRVDVRDQEQVLAAVWAAVDAFGSLDIVVNSAGVWSKRTIDDLAPTEWDLFQDVMVRGPMLLCKYALPHLRNAESASVVNIGSTGSLVGSRGGVHYGAAKGGLNLFGKSLALQLAKDGIRVNTVCAGPTETSLYEHVDGGIDSVREMVTPATPMGRMATPEEIASAALFLAGDEASFITGSTLVVDGGYTAQ